jgi:Pyridoxamine 5'-phosphate oxidase
MFETKKELKELQELLDSSFAKSKGVRYSGFNESNRYSARQLAGFRGVRLVAVATVNALGEPRAAPRSAAFLHGRFYLAANSGSTMVKRLAATPMLGITYYENHVLIMGHGKAFPIRKGTAEYKPLSRQWVGAFMGGDDSLGEGVDLLVRVDADHLVAFAAHPEEYPEAWGMEHPHAREAKAAA